MKFTKIVLAISFALLIQSFSELEIAGQEKSSTTLAEKHRIPDGSRLFISEMEGGLHTYIASEITKKKLPVVIVVEDIEADYVISGATLKGDDKWYQTVLGTAKDKNEGSIQVVSVKDRTLIWAGEAGDRSLMWGRFSRGGKSKVASRLVSKMKKELFGKSKFK